jgi:hypothetical protein
MRKTILIITLLAFPLVCFAWPVISEVTPKRGEDLSKEEIIEAAKSKAEELGFDLEETIIFYDEGNQQYEEYLKQGDISLNNTENELWKPYPPKFFGLPDINFQAVYLANCGKEGESLWVLVNRKNGIVDFDIIKNPYINLKEEEEQPQEYYITR